MSKDIKKALEHCIEWNCADCPNREELGSGETVCRGRLLPEVLEYVADLEAKLAEKEKTIQAYEKIVEQKDEETRFANRDKIYIVKQLNDPKDYVLLEDYKKVEQQLEEKDKEIKQLKKFDDLNKTFFELFRTAFKEPDKFDDLFNTLKTMQEKQYQDKISFAVEQLEKVKKFFIEEHRDEEMDTDYIITKDAGEIADYILDQIEQLKEGK